MHSVKTPKSPAEPPKRRPGRPVDPNTIHRKSRQFALPAINSADREALNGEVIPPYQHNGHHGSKINEYDRQQVSIMAYMNFNHLQIATALQISVPTLLASYKEELEHGFKYMGKNLVTHAFDIAMTDTKEGANMTQFLLRTKFGFNETTNLKVESKPTFVDSLDYET